MGGDPSFGRIRGRLQRFLPDRTTLCVQATRQQTIRRPAARPAEQGTEVRGGPADTATAVWVLEDDLSCRRRHLRTGDALRLPVRPADASLRGLLHPCDVVQPAWVAAADDPRASSLLLTGVVEQVDAVTLEHRRAADERWTPLPGSAAARTVPSTCSPDPARSVWIPSGRPVLIGFLLTVAGAALAAPA